MEEGGKVEPEKDSFQPEKDSDQRQDLYRSSQGATVGDGMGWKTQARFGQNLRNAIFQKVSTFITKKLGDLRLEAIKLGLGKIEKPPFTEAELPDLREQWAAILPSKPKALTVPERQPFLLGMESQSLELIGGPDLKVFMHGQDSLRTEVPAGFDEPLPRTPAVFPKKEKSHPLDKLDYQSVANNYKSAHEMAEELDRKFREEALGRMIPTTLAKLKARHPDRIPLVAAMGAIKKHKKPNGDVRLLYTMGQLNNQICFQNQLQYPGPEDAAAMMTMTDDKKDCVGKHGGHLWTVFSKLLVV